MEAGELLKSKIYERGYSLESFAKEINISKNKLNRKLNTEIEFTVREVSEIFVLLNLSYNELWDIFFK